MTVPAPDRPVPDGDLIDGWERGEEPAAAELVRRHARPLAAYLRGAGADLDEVDDLVQETFFRAFRRIATYRGGATFRTWLITIGSNVLKDEWRKRKRRQVLPIGDREFVDPGSDPVAEAAGRDLEKRVGEVVARLPPMQRDVFLLRAQQGAGYEDIATALGTTPGAARVHYHHAVKRLKKAIDE